MSKAGPHVVMGPREYYGQFVAEIAQASETLACVKCVDDFGAAAEAKAANPLTLTIGRINVVRAGKREIDMQAWEPQNYPSAQAAAAAYYALVKPLWLLNPFIDVWETFNEYSWHWGWQADFYIALMDLAEADGFTLGLWSTSGGNPPLPNLPVPAQRYISPAEAKNNEIGERSTRAMKATASAAAVMEEPWESIARACRRAKAHGNHIYCGHEYAWEGLLFDSWGDGVVGRYEAIDAYLTDVDADIPMALTECGQNGGGGFVGVAQFVRDIELCDMHWMTKPYLKAVSIWTLGRWSGANFQEALPALAQYIIGHPTPEPDPIDPPPVEDLNYDRVVHLVSQTITQEHYTRVAGEAFFRKESVVFSERDALLTSPLLKSRTVIVWNMAAFADFNGDAAAFEAWALAHFAPLPTIIYREF